MDKRPYQFPIQVGSLTPSLEKQFFRLMRGDKVVGGKFHGSRCVHQGRSEEIYNETTLGQSRRRGKGADRRKTNHVGIVIRSLNKKLEVQETVSGNSTMSGGSLKSLRKKWGQALRERAGVKVVGKC